MKLITDMGSCNTRQDSFRGAYNPIGYATSVDYSIKKVILLGDEQVGKSNIISQFVHNRFNAQYIQTVGSDSNFKFIESHGNKIKLQIWDLAGDERYRTIIESYFRGSQIIIIVYDKSNLRSFENLNYWLRLVAINFGSETPQLILVGNKSDLIEQVSTEKGRTFAYEHSMHFIETSALTNTNIDDIFKYELYDFDIKDPGHD